MITTRRNFLGVAGAAAAAPVIASAAAGMGTPPYSISATGLSPRVREAMERLTAYAAAELAAYGWPGMTLAFRAPDGSTATAVIGYAQIERSLPVRPEQLFQIGSISKSFVALSLLRLADRGKIDLDRPLLEVAPDFPVEDRRVTTAHILNHAAGFPGNMPLFAQVPGGRIWSGTTPGEHFAYSNTGYDLLGILIERLTGQPFDAAQRALALDPLGMAASEPVVRTAHRARYPRGYVGFRGDKPHFTGDLLAEQAWLDVDRAAGSVAAPASDMLRYIAFIGACAMGRPQSLLSPAAAKRFTTAVIAAPEFGPVARYGMGLATVPVDGRPALHHTGGMPAFTSAIHVDPMSGAGAFASVNVGYPFNYRPRQVTAHGVRLARALASGMPLPDAPAIVTMPAIPGVEKLAGRYLGPDGLALEFTPSAGGLALAVDGRPARLRPISATRFLTDDPKLVTHALEFEGADRLWWGGLLLGRGAVPEQPRPSPRLVAFAGRYRSDSPWEGDAGVVVRGDQLILEGAGRLIEQPGGYWALDDAEAAAERVWFAPPLNGVAQWMSFSGTRLMRTPIA